MRRPEIVKLSCLLLYLSGRDSAWAPVRSGASKQLWRMGRAVDVAGRTLRVRVYQCRDVAETSNVLRSSQCDSSDEGLYALYTMDPPSAGDGLPLGANGNTLSSDPNPSLAPPSTSVLSDAPTTDTLLPAGSSQASLPKASAVDETIALAPSFQTPRISAQTESILKRINVNAANAAAAGTPGWEAAREQIMKDMATSDKFPTPTPPRETEGSVPKQSQASSLGRGGKRASFVVDVNATGNHAAMKMGGETPQTTPATSGRGRGGGRPRGRGRGGGRGGKRKREERSEDDSDDSEVYSPAVTTTKSGRNVQKPTSFVPPPPSPTTTSKRKRPYTNRRNPEAAVCKICLRGTSPANNMIVFCDGCNTPYHRYCHHPPIDQAVVDEVDKEWYCKQCEKERVVPVPEEEVADFVSGEGASVEQVSASEVRRGLLSLTAGTAATILREPHARHAGHAAYESYDIAA